MALAINDIVYVSQKARDFYFQWRGQWRGAVMPPKVRIVLLHPDSATVCVSFPGCPNLWLNEMDVCSYYNDSSDPSADVSHNNDGWRQRRDENLRKVFGG